MLLRERQAASATVSRKPTALEQLHENVTVPATKLAAFCRENQIQRLSLFGSVLRKDFSDESDVDILVEFEPPAQPSLFDIARIESELSEIIDGRAIDL